ncbi:MAG: DUF350 domain-containing protein [Candidatus Pacebacteria bacterium]|nr:DUF350 domain-containing protein [Candidatus Paceibacterota bacterium]
MEIFTQYLITFGWALTAAISMAVAISIGLKIFTWIAPLDEWQEVKNGNMGMAIIIASVILGMALVVMFTING